MAEAWHRARRRVMDHLLRLVADSPWREGLVLRGSLVLTAWLGRVAREPGDIDFVVINTCEGGFSCCVSTLKSCGGSQVSAHYVTS